MIRRNQNCDAEPGGQSTDRVLARLLDAADYEPEHEPEYALGDFQRFVLTTLTRQRRHGVRARRMRTVRLASLCGAMASGGLLLVLATQGAPSGSYADMDRLLLRIPPPVSQVKVDSKSAAAEPDYPTEIAAALDEDRAPRATARPAAGTRPVSYRAPRRRASREESHGRTEPAPEAIWKTETVRRYATGVIAPAWVEQPGQRKDEVTYRPVAVEMGVQSREEPRDSTADAGSAATMDPSITLTSYSAGEPGR